MKRLKLFSSVLLVILLSGCTATYNLNIDKDGVNEEIVFSETKEELSTYTTSIYSFLDEELQNIKEEGKYNSYTMSVDVDSDYGSGIGNRKYSNFENYKNSSIILTEMFDNVSIEKNDNITTIIMSPKRDFEYFEDDSQYTSLLDQVKINITTPYEVTNSNADSSNEDTYTWTIKKKEALKEVRISYNTDINIISEIPITTWIIVGIVVSIIIISLYIYIRYKMNSR